MLKFLMSWETTANLFDVCVFVCVCVCACVQDKYEIILDLAS